MTHHEEVFFSLPWSLPPVVVYSIGGDPTGVWERFRASYIGEERTQDSGDAWVFTRYAGTGAGRTGSLVVYQHEKPCLRSSQTCIAEGDTCQDAPSGQHRGLWRPRRPSPQVRSPHRSIPGRSDVGCGPASASPGERGCGRRSAARRCGRRDGAGSPPGHPGRARRARRGAPPRRAPRA